MHRPTLVVALRQGGSLLAVALLGEAVIPDDFSFLAVVILAAVSLLMGVCFARHRHLKGTT